MGIKRLIKNLIRDYRYKKTQKKENFQLISTELILQDLDSLPTSDRPEVSIIIPVYNQIEYTLNCLFSIKNAKEKTEFEIIIVNDCSSDNTSHILKQIKGIKIIENSKNQGFLKSVNNGIQNAAGKFVHLLNNDTIVQPGFLDHLVSTIKETKNVGAVGSKLIYPNHILQEAGCLVYDDRNIVNIGRNQSPDNPEYNFLKKVDYCSGCSLLFRTRNQKNELNLLDEIYAPAYYEETDLCMRFKYEQNLDVYYQPLSVVVHFENISHNTEKVSASKTSLMQKNADTFYNKWGKHFKQKMIIKPGLNINKNYTNPSILFVETFFPKFDHDSGANRIIQIMKFLVKNDYKVYLITMNEDKKDEDYINLYESYGIHILRDFVNEKNEIISQKKQLKDLDGYINKIWISRIETYHYFVKYYQAFISKKPTIYDMVDFQYLRLKREVDLGKSTLSHKDLISDKEREMKAIISSDKVIAISNTEKDFLIDSGVMEDKIFVISNIHEPITCQNKIDFEDRKDIIFVGGGSHKPNIDAILYLYDIMEIVWQQHPEITVYIIGNSMPEKITELNSNRFVIKGFVKNIEPFFLNTKMTVAPLRYGAGVKGKIGQALEYSLPIVTTTIGAEGMGLQSEFSALISETHDKEKLAKDIIRLYTDKILWQTLSENSKKAIEKFTTEGQKEEIFKLLST